jgi:hypothetical protein
MIQDIYGDRFKAAVKNQGEKYFIPHNGYYQSDNKYVYHWFYNDKLDDWDFYQYTLEGVRI